MLVAGTGQAYAPGMRMGVGSICLLAVMVLSVGCAPKGTPVDPGTRAARPGDDDDGSALPKWYPHAVDLRVHPASRYIREDKSREGEKDLILEARIELLDELNEPVKDTGRFVVELRLLDDNGRIVLDEGGRQRGFRWAFDLTTIEAQRDHWDPIARAYILSLKIDPEEKDLTDFRTVLRVTFDPAWPDMPTLPTGEKARQPVEIRTDW